MVVPSVGVPRVVIGWRELRRQEEEESGKRWRRKNRGRGAGGSLRRYYRDLDLSRERSRLRAWRRRGELVADAEALALFREAANARSKRRRS